MNITPPSAERDTKSDQGGKKTYHCGTLTYTKIGLVALFTSLLWSDFCYTILESVVPGILPLKLKELGSANWLMGLLLTTIPSALSMFVGPYVSFKSDRCRSRWGRRIPFIAGTMPFLCISLVLLAFCNEIQIFLQNYFPFLHQYTPATVLIVLIGLFFTAFQFYNMFVMSVFFGLFNDVVPPQFIGRFIGLLRVVRTRRAYMKN